MAGFDRGVYFDHNNQLHNALPGMYSSAQSAVQGPLQQASNGPNGSTLTLCKTRNQVSRTAFQVGLAALQTPYCFASWERSQVKNLRPVSRRLLASHKWDPSAKCTSTGSARSKSRSRSRWIRTKSAPAMNTSLPGMQSSALSAGGETGAPASWCSGRSSGNRCRAGPRSPEETSHRITHLNVHIMKTEGVSGQNGQNSR